MEGVKLHDRVLFGRRKLVVVGVDERRGDFFIAFDSITQTYNVFRNGKFFISKYLFADVKSYIA
jgi:hypothetical protein